MFSLAVQGLQNYYWENNASLLKTNIHEVPTVCQNSRTQPRGWIYRLLFVPDPKESEKQNQHLYLYNNGLTVKITNIFKTHAHCLEMTRPSKHCDMHYGALGAVSIGYRSCKSILRGKPPSKALFHI